MKKTSIFFAIISSIFLFSCNQNASNNQEVSTDSLAIKSTCYIAVFETDTAYLKTQIDTNGMVTGEMTIKYGELKANALEKGSNTGTIEGDFRGDTLFVYYNHTSGSIYKKGFKNPLALLKEGDNMVLGVGEILTQVGQAYFVKGKPIDFASARFRFVPMDCEE
jgi:hypothetical protein